MYILKRRKAVFVVDMHCDSLSTVNEENGLVNKYNVPTAYPFLQFFAHWSKKGSESAEMRRSKLLSAFDTYLYESDRLKRVFDSKDVFEATDENSKSAIFSIEGGGGLFSDSRELLSLRNAGLTVLGMAWDSNELSASAWDEEDTGLSDEGKKMVHRCEELGIILDVSHMSDKAFFELFEISPLPHIATHSNFREICPSKRNLTREMAEILAARGGVIGMNIYPPFLTENKTATLDDLIRHIDYGLEIVGENAIGFGFDIDGTDGEYPHDLSLDRSIHEQVIDKLAARYGDTVTRKIAGENVIEFLKNNMI